MTDPDPNDPKNIPLSPLLRLHTRPQAKSREEYVDALEKYVYAKFEVRILGSPLVDLNRRFSLLAKRYNLPVAYVAGKLENEGRLLLLVHRGNLIAFPPGLYNDYVDGMEWETVSLLLDASLRDVGRNIPFNTTKK